MWHVSVLDIERTLTMATQKVCRDHSVSWLGLGLGLGLANPNPNPNPNQVCRDHSVSEAVRKRRMEP